MIRNILEGLFIETDMKYLSNEIFDDPRFREPRKKKEPVEDEKSKVGVYLIPEEPTRKVLDDGTKVKEWSFLIAPAPSSLSDGEYSFKYNKTYEDVYVGSNVADAYSLFKHRMWIGDKQRFYKNNLPHGTPYMWTAKQVHAEDYPDYVEYIKSLGADDFNRADD